MSKSNATTNFSAKFPANHKITDNFDFIEKYLNYSCLTLKIENLKDINVSNNCVLYKNFQIIADSCITDAIFNNYHKNYKFFLKYFFRQIAPKKPLIHIANEYYSNYFHWHEILQKIILLKEQNLLQNHLIILPSKSKKIKFISESLQTLGVGFENIFFINKKSHVKVKNLTFVNHRGFDYELINKLRDQLTTAVNHNQTNYGERIYISRAKQKLRFVENEQEILKVLEKYNFKKVIMEDHSYQQQLAICSKAKYLIAPHGAGLTNIIAMAKNSCVLELSSKNDLDFDRNYLIMANLLAINYFYQRCQFGENSIIKDSHHASLEVDCQKLAENINLMLQIKI